jgi:hypothetical protein
MRNVATKTRPAEPAWSVTVDGLITPTQLAVRPTESQAVRPETYPVTELNDREITDSWWFWGAIAMAKYGCLAWAVYLIAYNVIYPIILGAVAVAGFIGSAATLIMPLLMTVAIIAGLKRLTGWVGDRAHTAKAPHWIQESSVTAPPVVPTRPKRTKTAPQSAPRNSWWSRPLPTQTRNSWWSRPLPDTAAKDSWWSRPLSTMAPARDSWWSRPLPTARKTSARASKANDSWWSQPLPTTPKKQHAARSAPDKAAATPKPAKQHRPKPEPEPTIRPTRVKAPKQRTARRRAASLAPTPEPVAHLIGRRKRSACGQSARSVSNPPKHARKCENCKAAARYGTQDPPNISDDGIATYLYN